MALPTRLGMALNSKKSIRPSWFHKIQSQNSAAHLGKEGEAGATGVSSHAPRCCSHARSLVLLPCPLLGATPMLAKASYCHNETAPLGVLSDARSPCVGRRECCGVHPLGNSPQLFEGGLENQYPGSLLLEQDLGTVLHPLSPPQPAPSLGGCGSQCLT